ncbi:MAG: type II toxin-antitoxin system VapC family toxin [Caldilineaceae bacterium]
MNLLLDLHIFLWLASEPQRLPAAIVAAVTSPDNSCYLSIVSVWELQIKVGTGKLKLPIPIQQFVTINRAMNQIDSLSLTESHIWTLGGLPSHHRDPFDRILIAQAITEGWTVATVDRIFTRYPAKLLNQ